MLSGYVIKKLEKEFKVSKKKQSEKMYEKKLYFGFKKYSLPFFLCGIRNPLFYWFRIRFNYIIRREKKNLKYLLPKRKKDTLQIFFVMLNVWGAIKWVKENFRGCFFPAFFFSNGKKKSYIRSLDRNKFYFFSKETNFYDHNVWRS